MSITKPKDVPDVSDVTGVPDSITPPLDAVRQWWGRFIITTDPNDLDLLTLWTVHTHLIGALRSTPRLIISSVEAGSGKTTVLEHMEQLAYQPERISGRSTDALLGRMTKDRNTLMIDEADKSLRRNDPGSDAVFEILNTGYKHGGVRPVLKPDASGDWQIERMSTFAPAIITGNNPYLPEDTRQRALTINLLKDSNGLAEESDWFELEESAAQLKESIDQWAEQVREQAEQYRPDFPDGFVGRMKEVWRPLLTVADLAGGDWPKNARILAESYRDNLLEDIEHGLTTKSAERMLLEEIHTVWRLEESFIATATLVTRLRALNGFHAPEHGAGLTSHALGLRLRGLGIRASQRRQDGTVARGYTRAAFKGAWESFGLSRLGGASGTGTAGTAGTPGTATGNGEGA